MFPYGHFIVVRNKTYNNFLSMYLSTYRIHILNADEFLYQMKVFYAKRKSYFVFQDFSKGTGGECLKDSEYIYIPICCFLVRNVSHLNRFHRHEKPLWSYKGLEYKFLQINIIKQPETSFTKSQTKALLLYTLSTVENVYMRFVSQNPLNSNETRMNSFVF